MLEICLLTDIRIMFCVQVRVMNIDFSNFRQIKNKIFQILEPYISLRHHVHIQKHFFDTI